MPGGQVLGVVNRPGLHLVPRRHVPVKPPSVGVHLLFGMQRRGPYRMWWRKRRLLHDLQLQLGLLLQ